MIDTTPIRDRFAALAPRLDERGRRSFAAAEASSAGYGGIAAVARANGIAPSTIGRGLDELAGTSNVPADRSRRPGAGRKTLTATNPMLLDDLLALVSPSERGDPMSPLRWTCKGLRRLASELQAMGHKISHTVVDRRIVSKHGYAIARGKLFEKVGKGWQGRRGERDCFLRSIGPHKTDIGPGRRAAALRLHGRRSACRRGAMSVGSGSGLA